MKANLLAGFVVTASDHLTLNAAGPKASPVFTLDGLETDASLVIVRRDLAGEILNHFVRDATCLRVAGQAITP